LHHAQQIPTACEEHAPDSDYKGLALDRELAASEKLIRDLEFTAGSHGGHFMFSCIKCNEVHMVGREVGRARGVNITTCNYGVNYNFFRLCIITIFIVIVARLL
jgi:hypothetical protein